MTTVLPDLLGRRVSYSEYLTLPEDVRAELIDGRIEVVNAASFRHQRALWRLANLLEATLPPGLTCSLATAWHIRDDWEPSPDLMVVPKEDFGARFRGTPALVVEALSPSNRRNDLVDKKRGYAIGGAPFYWILDAEVPSVQALQLVDGAWVEVAATVGDVRATLPYAGGTLTFAAADLVDL